MFRLLVFFTIALTLPVAGQTRPHIVLIMADDLGYGDVSCYGATALETPHIDRLAADGLRFTSGYCSASTCTPTRYSLLTGTYAFREEGTGIAPPNSPALISPGTETLPSLLKRAGYRTAVVGKWHLGLGGPDGPDWNGELKPGPLEIGFGYSFLLPTTNDRVPSVYVQSGYRSRRKDGSFSREARSGGTLAEASARTDRSRPKPRPQVVDSLTIWRHGYRAFPKREMLTHSLYRRPVDESLTIPPATLLRFTFCEMLTHFPYRESASAL